MAVPPPLPISSLVTWMERYSLSTSGQAPWIRHVCRSSRNVRRCGSPNTLQYRWKRRPENVQTGCDAGGTRDGNGSRSTCSTGPSALQLNCFMCFSTTRCELWKARSPRHARDMFCIQRRKVSSAVQCARTSSGSGMWWRVSGYS